MNHLANLLVAGCAESGAVPPTSNLSVTVRQVGCKLTATFAGPARLALTLAPQNSQPGNLQSPES